MELAPKPDILNEDKPSCPHSLLSLSSLSINIFIFLSFFFLTKPILWSLYFCFFSTFHLCIFILRYCIFVLLFSYRFRPSQPQNRQPGFFFSVVDICTALGFPQLHIGSSIAALPPSSSIFFFSDFLSTNPNFFFQKNYKP